MTTARLVLLLAVLHLAKPQQVHQPNLSLLSTNQWAPSYGNYEKVSLTEPRFKSKQLAGLGWYNQESLESGAGQRRHLEWLESSGSDSESAESTEKGILAEWLEDDDDQATSSIDMIADKKNSDLRQHRKKYVKVDKMLLPLLLAYKLKFFTMVPVLIGAMVLLVGTTGLAGFFFALFAAAAGLHVKG